MSTEWYGVPDELVAVTVIVYGPEIVEVSVETPRTIGTVETVVFSLMTVFVGLNVRPGLVTDVVTVTLPVKPNLLVIVTVELAEVVLRMFREAGLALMVKSGTGNTTATATLIELVRVPLVPDTVTL
jgi:hypothetical protein